eukprot:EST48836.1 Hypothetical protein SS50377_10932 [Spironucleus salmonicida]
MYSEAQLLDIRIQNNSNARIRAMHSRQQFTFRTSTSPQNLNNQPVIISTPKIFSPLHPPPSAKIYELQLKKNLKTPKILNEIDEFSDLSLFEEKCKIFHTINQAEYLTDDLEYGSEICIIAKQIFMQFFSLQSCIDYCPNAVLVASIQSASKIFNVQFNFENEEFLSHFEYENLDKIIQQTEKIVFENCLNPAYFTIKQLLNEFNFQKILEITQIYTFQLEAVSQTSYFSTPKIESFTPQSSTIEEVTQFNMIDELLNYSMQQYPDLQILSSSEIQQELDYLNIKSVNFEQDISIITIYRVFSQILSILLNYDYYLLNRAENILDQCVRISLNCIINQQLLHQYKQVSQFSVSQICQQQFPQTPLFHFNNFDDSFQFIENHKQLCLLKNILEIQQQSMNHQTITSLKSLLYQITLEIDNYFIDNNTQLLFCQQPGSFIYCVKSMNKVINFEIDSERYEQLVNQLDARKKDLACSNSGIQKEIEGIKVKYGVIDGCIFGGF